MESNGKASYFISNGLLIVEDDIQGKTYVGMLVDALLPVGKIEQPSEAQEDPVSVSTMEEIGKKIKDVRESMGLSIYKVGKRAGINPSIVKSIELANSAYTIDSLIKVCDVLGLELVVTKKGSVYGN